MPSNSGLDRQSNSRHKGQIQRRHQLPGVGVRITGQLPALPEEGLGLAVQIRVLDTDRELEVGADAGPGQVVAAKDDDGVIDEDQLLVQGAIARHDLDLPAGVEQALGRLLIRAALADLDRGGGEDHAALQTALAGGGEVRHEIDGLVVPAGGEEEHADVDPAAGGGQSGMEFRVVAGIRQELEGGDHDRIRPGAGAGWGA